MEFAAESQNSRAEIAAFLASVFRVAESAPIIDPNAMQWKIFDSRPDWEGSRGLALRRNGEIVGFTVVCPLHFVTAEREVTGIHPVDWAGHPQVPGSGVQVLRYLMRMTETLLGIGGSGRAQAIFPPLA